MQGHRVGRTRLSHPLQGRALDIYRARWSQLFPSLVDLSRLGSTRLVHTNYTELHIASIVIVVYNSKEASAELFQINH